MKSKAMATQKKRSLNRGFTLVEVVVSFAIFVFAGFALLGLLGAVTQSTRDSKQQLQAATIAEAICSTRRAAPTADLTASLFPLPTLGTPASTLNAPIGLTWDGVQTSSVSAADARFGMIYSIKAPAAGNYTPGVTPGQATVYLCIYWPAQAPATNPATGRFELTTSFLLP